jgi:hypothetical protein
MMFTFWLVWCGVNSVSTLMENYCYLFMFVVPYILVTYVLFKSSWMYNILFS